MLTVTSFTLVVLRAPEVDPGGGLTTQTVVAIVAATAAVGSVFFSWLNTSRQIENNRTQTRDLLTENRRSADVASYQQAADEMTGHLILARNDIEFLERAMARDYVPRVPRLSPDEMMIGHLETRREQILATQVSLDTAEIVFRSRCVEGDVLATQVEEAVRVFDALCRELGDLIEGYVEPQEFSVSLETAQETFSRRYADWVRQVKTFKTGVADDAPPSHAEGRRRRFSIRRR